MHHTGLLQLPITIQKHLNHRNPILLSSIHVSFSRQISSSSKLLFSVETNSGKAGSDEKKDQSVQKPRASTGATKGKISKRSFFKSVLLIGTGMSVLIGVGYYLSQQKSVKKMIDDAMFTFGYVTEAVSSGNPSLEELSRSLGPVPPEPYGTLILTLDDCIMKKEWDRKYGFKYELRPGIKELLKTATENAFFIVFWSDNSANGVIEILQKLQLDDQAYMQVSYNPLHLGSEHMLWPENINEKEVVTYNEDGSKKLFKEKHIEYLGRDPSTILLVDIDERQEKLNPANTICVRSMSTMEKEKEQSSIGDSTLQAVSLVLQRIRSDATNVFGKLNVKRSLEEIRKEASTAGFSSDANGVYTHLLKQANAETEAEEKRKNEGLGTLIKSITPSLQREKPKAVMEINANKRYISVYESSGFQDSFLAQKAASAVSKLEKMTAGPGM
jgi:NLI interacting factor-like phosphatase